MKNYEASANTDDGSCYPFIHGCMNSSACNYEQLVGNVLQDVNTDDGSCIVPRTDAPHCEQCDGTVLDTSDDDTNNNGRCDRFDKKACTDERGCNYGWYNKEYLPYTVNGETYYRDSDFPHNFVNAGCDIPPAGKECNTERTEWCYLSDTHCDQVFRDCVDVNVDSICDSQQVFGCTNPDACNYDADATHDHKPNNCVLLSTTECQRCDYYLGWADSWSGYCNLPTSCGYDPTKVGDICAKTDPNDYPCDREPSEDNCNYCDGNTLVVPNVGPYSSNCFIDDKPPECVGDTIYFKPDTYGGDGGRAKCRQAEELKVLLQSQIREKYFSSGCDMGNLKEITEEEPLLVFSLDSDDFQDTGVIFVTDTSSPIIRTDANYRNKGVALTGEWKDLQVDATLFSDQDYKLEGDIGDFTGWKFYKDEYSVSGRNSFRVYSGLDCVPGQTFKVGIMWYNNIKTGSAWYNDAVIINIYRRVYNQDTGRWTVYLVDKKQCDLNNAPGCSTNPDPIATQVATGMNFNGVGVHRGTPYDKSGWDLDENLQIVYYEVTCAAPPGEQDKPEVAEYKQKICPNTD